MMATLTVFLVPALAVVVLSALLVTSRFGYRSVGIGMTGVMGVIFGGPGAALMLAASDADSGPATNLHEPIHAEVSAELKTRPVATRPAWIEEAPAREEGTHTQVVSSGPHVRIQDAYKALDEQLKEETDQYVRWYLSSDAAPGIIDLDLDYIKKHLQNPDLHHSETRDYSVGPMQTMYARLDFDEQFRQHLDGRWREEVSKNRLWFTALAGGGVFLLLLTLFGFFRLDTATRGYYTGRLQFLTVAAILALIAAGVIAVRWVDVRWLN